MVNLQWSFIRILKTRKELDNLGCISASLYIDSEALQCPFIVYSSVLMWEGVLRALTMLSKNMCGNQAKLSLGEHLERELEAKIVC